MQGQDRTGRSQHGLRPRAGGHYRRALWTMGGLAAVAGSALAFAKMEGGPAPAGSDRTGVVASTRSASGPPTQKAHIARSSVRTLAAGQQLELAFDAVFGNGARQIALTDEVSFSYGRGQLVWTEFGPVLIAEGSGDPYPPALGTLGIFYLRELPNGRFEETGRWPDAVTGGSMGNPPNWKLREDLADYPVIEASAGGVWQGYACDATSLTQLTPEGPKSLVTFDSYYDSRSASGSNGEFYTGAIGNVVRNRSFDVRFTGSREFTRRFVRDGAGYSIVPGEDGGTDDIGIPTC